MAHSTQIIADNEKELAWREIAKQIAHEIKNPLTPMKLSLQQLRRMQNSENFDDYFKNSTNMLIEQIDNLSYIANTFSSFAKMAPTKLIPVNIIDRLVTVLHLYKNNDEEIEINYDSAILHSVILGDSEQLMQLFNNLIKNAMQAIPSDRAGVVDVKVENEEGYILITITDNGDGIKEELVENIFKPNFTTKSSGMGIGLCLVKNYVAAMNGEITFITKEFVGTSFILKFPIIKT